MVAIFLFLVRNKKKKKVVYVHLKHKQLIFLDRKSEFLPSLPSHKKIYKKLIFKSFIDKKLTVVQFL